ncbi:MAG: flagellar basal body-associated FliL family protein [Candidatus Nanopelagicales bacterium]
MAVSEMLSRKEAPDEAPKKKGRAKTLIAVVVVVAAILGAGWFLLLRPAPEQTGPEPGEVLALDSIQINLAGGHYLRVGVALQLTASAHEAEGSKALDATIDLFSGRSMDELALPDQREELKKELLEDLDHAYHGDVMGVYFTDFVTQ